jgi:hypothetical protein
MRLYSLVLILALPITAALAQTSSSAPVGHGLPPDASGHCLPGQFLVPGESGKSVCVGARQKAFLDASAEAATKTSLITSKMQSDYAVTFTNPKLGQKARTAAESVIREVCSPYDVVFDPKTHKGTCFAGRPKVAGAGTGAEDGPRQ